MVRQCTRQLILAGVVVACLAATARADHCCAAPCAPAAPCMRTICERVCVPETYTATRTVYDRVCREEKYTTYRCEYVPQQQTRTCTVYKMVSETKPVTRTVWECVPTVETRTIMQTHVTCKPVTTMVRKCVDRGHYECCEVPCPPTLRERLKKLCRKNDCCDDCCVRTKTVRKWVPCLTYEEVPCTTMQRVCENRPVTCNVTVNKMVARQVTENCTVCRCVPEQKTEVCTVMVAKQVPCEATRTVATCVPRQEQYTCTRNVWKTVERQVPVETCCQSSCCDSSCGSCCGKSKGRLFKGAGLACRSRGCCN